MEFWTSYYGNSKNIPEGYLKVGVSRYCPEGLEGDENFVFVKDNLLAPSEGLLKKYKGGEIGEIDYKRIYVEELFERFKSTKWKDAGEWIGDVESEYKDKYKGIVFLCYEKPEDFCHRHIVAKLLTNVYGVECREFKNDKKETALF